jgi:hypothetical protein
MQDDGSGRPRRRRQRQSIAPPKPGHEPEEAEIMNTRFCLSLVCSALLASGVPAAAQDIPKRKPGLWEMSMQMQGQGGMPAITTRQCVDEQSDAEMHRKAFAGNDAKTQCKQLSNKKIAGGVEIEAECRSDDGGTVKTLARITGDMQTSYTMENDMTFSPPKNGMSKAKLSMKGTHRGACPAGMKGGDIQMTHMGGPGGMAIDMEKLKKMSPEEQRKWAEQMQKQMGK